jgi:hypothetical protein
VSALSSLSPPLTPSARRQEIVAILAKGVLRWHQRVRAADNADPQNPPQSIENGLEFPAETRLSGPRTRGLSPREDGDNA